MLNDVSIDRDDDGSVWLRATYAGLDVTVGAWPDSHGAGLEVQEAWSDINNDEPSNYVTTATWAAILADAQNNIDIWSA